MVVPGTAQEHKRRLESELQVFVDRWSRDPSIKMIILFGSVARGDIHRGSDLDLIKTTEEVIDSYKEKHDNLTLFALDSLNALYSISEHDNMRNKIYNFFSHLRDEGLTSFLIMESAQSRISGQFSPSHQIEHFLADGTIELGMIEGQGGVKRYIQILKMRAAKHAMEKHQLTIGDNGINILGPIY